MLRVDGRGCSKPTEANFAKPYDEHFRGHMLAAASTLMTEFDGIHGYTVSDEISIVLSPTFDGFSRSVEKLVSISAGLASATFTAAAGLAVHFDSRAWIGAGVADVIDYLVAAVRRDPGGVVQLVLLDASCCRPDRWASHQRSRRA